MKKKSIFFVVFLLFLTVSFAQALPTYYVTATADRIGTGGPFLITDVNDLTFQTFCIESLESIAQPGTFYGSIDPMAWYSSGDSLTRGAIADGTKRLYSYFLDSYDTLTDIDKRNIQLAIWDLQDQPGWDGTQSANYFFINSGTFDLTRNVYALNFWTNPDGYVYGSRVQSMLIETVPEPASMVLFGLGLFGLAGIRRKIKK